MKLLQGKNVIITGASRGIGKGIAEVFAKHGANIAFTYASSEGPALELEKELTALGIKAKAGITKDNLLMRMSEDDFDKVIQVNLKSVFNMTKAVQRTMLKQRYGSIVNMSSIVGVKGNAGQTNYAASKAGIIGFSKSVALELGSRNIRCNSIAPGFIETEMTDALNEETVQSWRNAIPLKRGGTPEDVANACVFLASDLSSYITGQTLHVDGGMLT
jgi:3-oxoacyl-[acyl-carrier protein] reductase